MFYSMELVSELLGFANDVSVCKMDAWAPVSGRTSRDNDNNRQAWGIVKQKKTFTGAGIFGCGI